MQLFLSKIVSSILQIIIFTIVPFLWWFVTARKQQKFVQWIGLKKPEFDKRALIAIIITTIAFLFLGVLTFYTMKGVETATSEFAGLGIKAIPAMIIYAAFNTALPEELFYLKDS